jgi:tRNA threonylcarbamoyladenosine biosynthesis protein TsaB
VTELSIDTASDMAGVALTDGPELLAERTWYAHQSHSRDLLPTIDKLLGLAGKSKDDLRAVFVCVGPGSYAGLRVGISTAKALAYALGIPIVGVGRLEAQALPFAGQAPRVYAVHAAGRAELAVAVYTTDEEGNFLEQEAPHLMKRDAFVTSVPQDALVVGDLDDATREAMEVRGISWTPEPGGNVGSGEPGWQPVTRVVSVAFLGWVRLKRGEIDSAESLVPLYLREPAIGPQPPP